MEHLGKLPPRETADALVYRCLDSMEPFLSKVTSNHADKTVSSNLDNPNSHYTRSDFQTRGIDHAAYNLALLIIGSIWNSGKILKASPQPGFRCFMEFFAAVYGWTTPPTLTWQA